MTIWASCPQLLLVVLYSRLLYFVLLIIVSTLTLVVVARQQVETKSSSKAKRSLGFSSGKEIIPSKPISTSNMASVHSAEVRVQKIC